MKKILKYTGFTLLALMAILLLIPVLFKSKIVALVKTEINKSLDAKVEFADVSLSWFRHFPRLSLGLNKVSITGNGDFAKDTLLSAEKFDAAVNIMSVVRGKDISVYGVFLESPRIHALVNKEGKANWDIARKDTAVVAPNGQPSPFHLSLNRYTISNGYVYYNDASAGMKAEISGLEHEGSGNFTQDLFTLATKTKAASAYFSYAGIPYLLNVQTGVDADIDVDTKTNTYSFKNAAVAVNDLKLTGNGFFRLVNDSTYGMDINFDAPSNDFKSILSLVPAIYKKDFNSLKTSGTAAFKGFVKGTYSPTQLPAYNVDLGIKNGFFQYPDLPDAVKNIQLAANFSNVDGALDNTVVDITKGHVEMGNEPFDFKILFKNPETAKYIDAVIKGKINLADVTKFVKLEDGMKLSGILDADAFAKGNMSALEAQKGPFTAGGFFNIDRFYFASKQIPQPVQNGQFSLHINNMGGIADATTVNVVAGHLEVGKDPLDFTLDLDHPMTAINFKGTVNGHFTLDNIKQFVALEPGTSIKGLMTANGSFAGSKADIDAKKYDRINLNGVASVSGVQYISKDYPEGVTISNAQVKFSPQTIALENFAGSFHKTNFTASGTLGNVIGYAMDNSLLTGNVSVEADKMNLNEWMGTDTSTASSSSSAPFAVPANMNLALHAKAGSVQYDKVNYKNVHGTLLLKDEAVILQDVQTDALDGSIAFNGAYATKNNKAKPDISLSYDVKNVDVQQAFFAYNTVQKLMPVGKFLAGKLSSQFSMTGKLGGDMMPDLNSLTGNGNLLLIQGILGKFAPLDKLASTLNVSALKDISLKDIKTHFEFTNGKVLVKPFNVKVKDIDMQIGGMHGIDQSIDYIIGMKIPRSYMGATGNALMNNLAAQANSKGIPVTLSDVVDLNVKMGGSISNPTISTDLKQVAGDATKELKQKATAFVQNKIDSAKQTFKDSLNVVKKQVLSDAKNEIAKQLFGKKDSTGGSPADSTKKKAAETIKNTLNGLFKKKKG